MFDILNTEDTVKLESVLKQAKAFREEVDTEDLIEEEKFIDINPEFLDIFLKSDKKSKKKGQLAKLVKKISKPSKPRKKRLETKLVALDKIQGTKLKRRQPQQLVQQLGQLREQNI